MMLDGKQNQEVGFVPNACSEFIGFILSIQDDRLLDNTHLAKQKFGGSKGDSWADKASEDLLKVKGKGSSVNSEIQQRPKQAKKIDVKRGKTHVKRQVRSVALDLPRDYRGKMLHSCAV